MLSTLRQMPPILEKNNPQCGIISQKLLTPLEQDDPSRGGIKQQHTTVTVPTLPLTTSSTHTSLSKTPSVQKLMIITSGDDNDSNINGCSGDNDDEPQTQSIPKCQHHSNNKKKKHKGMRNNRTPHHPRTPHPSNRNHHRSHTPNRHHNPAHHHFHRKAIATLKQVKQEAKHLEIKKQNRRLVKTPRAPSLKNALRNKFIAQAKSYIGTPYAKKFYDPSSTTIATSTTTASSLSTPTTDSLMADDASVEYTGKYLDCCGLIRQVLRDLQNDFGFIPGDWNQVRLPLHSSRTGGSHSLYYSVLYHMSLCG